jgi:hypothetical protein
MTTQQLLRWTWYFEARPPDSVRQDFRIANIVQMLFNINRDPQKNPDPLPLTQFLLPSTDKLLEELRPKKKSWKDMLGIAHMIAAVQNAIFEKGERTIDG